MIRRTLVGFAMLMRTPSVIFPASLLIWGPKAAR